MRSVAALVAGAVAVVVGCGGVSLDPVAKAAAATQDEQTMKVDFQFSGASGGATTSGTGTGVFDTSDRTGQLTMRFDVGIQPVSIESRQKGFVVYMRSPLFDKQLPAGKHWVELDLEKAAKQQGIDFSQFTTQQAGNSLQQLEATTGGVDKVGEEQVAGVQTTHYKATIDFDKVVEQADTDAQKQSYRNVEKLMASKTVPVEVWVDGDDHVRKLSQSYSVRDPKSGATTDTTMSMTFVAFGVPVNVEIPPADEVVDATNG